MTWASSDKVMFDAISVPSSLSKFSRRSELGSAVMFTILPSFNKMVDGPHKRLVPSCLRGIPQGLRVTVKVRVDK